MREEIESLDGNRLLNTAVADLTGYFVDKYKIEPIALLRDEWYAETKEMKVDVRYDQLRWIQDQSKPALVAGERTEVRIPFKGEAELFYSRSNMMSTNPPRAPIEGNELVLRYDMPSDAPRDVRPLVDQALNDIEQYIGWQRLMIDGHNTTLPGLAQPWCEAKLTILGRKSVNPASLAMRSGLSANASH